jgi:uncharacterized protein YhdP
MKRIVIFLLEIIAALIVCVFVGLGLLMVRLEQGPVSLAPYLPEITGALSDLSPGLTFKIDNAQLEANDEHRSLRMHLQNIRLFNKDKQPVGVLKDVMLGFNWRNLAGFTYMPVALEMSHPALTVTRFSNGTIGFNLEEVSPDAEHAASMTDLTTLLSHIPKELRHVQITDAILHYEDQQKKTSFIARNGLFEFSRTHDIVTGTMGLDIAAGDFKQHIKGTIIQDDKNHSSDLIVALKDFRLDQMRGFIPALPADLKLDIPFDLLLTATIGSPLQIKSVDLQVTGKNGTLQYAPYLPQALSVSALFAKVEYLPTENKIHLQSLGLNLEQSTILAVGSVTRTPDKNNKDTSDTNITFKALAENVPVDKLPVYWPVGVAHNARDWVTTHIHSGKADRAVINLDAMMTPDQQVTINTMGGRIDFQHASLDYLPPMPQIDDISGQARFTDKNFDVVATSGQVFDTKIKTATAHITDLLGDNPAITINTDTTGPVHDSLTVISSKPLEYTQKMGLVTDNFSGNTHTNVTLSFPLLNDLKLDQVHIDLTSELQDLKAKNIVKDLTVSAKSLVLKINEKELSLDGDAQLADAPSHVTWHEYFTDDAQYGSTIDANGKFTPALLQGLRIPADIYFKGSAQGEAHITIDKNKTTNVAAKADLAQSEITIPEITIVKKSGVAGTLNLKLASDTHGVTTISDSSVSWNDFGISNAAVKFSDANGLESATLNDIRAGRSKAQLTVTPTGPNAVKAVIKADTLDLSGYWTKKKSIDDKPSTKKIDLSLRANTLFLDHDTPLKNVRVDAVTVGSDLHHGLIAADTDDKGSLVLQETESSDNSRHLAIKANNAGSVLQALDLSDAVRGGTLTVIGDSTAKAPAVIEGRLVLDDFNMVHAPVLARMLNALSPGGLLNLLDTKGLKFSRLESNYVLPDPKTIKVSKGKMNGDSLGLSFSGTINRENSTLDLNGTIVPLQGINRLANIIPILGKILTGTNGNGIIGATYTITGPNENPNVSVNALSALTPGILRSLIFESSDD